jgi:conjugative transfer pilus assembly protein TraH
MVTQKRFFKITMTAVLVCTFAGSVIAPVATAGDWVGDWLKNAQGSSGGSIQTQQRGFYMGGNYSLHTPSKTDSFVSARAPSFSAGCGGIDFFAGSISFMSADQLVAKLQRILQNAAGVAFQMALETLCSKCVQIMNSMESIANALNGMSMNDCQAAKGLVTGLKSSVQAAFDDNAANTVAGAVEKGVTDAGWGQMKTQIAKAGDALGNLGTASMGQLNNWGNGFKDPANPDKSSTVSGCSGTLGDMLPRTNEQTSVIEFSGARIGMAANHIEMVRGLVGDLGIADVDGAMVPTYVEGCSDNKMKAWMATGDIYTMPFDKSTGFAPCSTAQVKSSVQADVATRMKNIATALSSKGNLVPADLDFLAKLPMPVMQGLRMAVTVGAPDELISNLAGVVADMHIIMAIRGAVVQARALNSSVNAALREAAMNDKATCKVGGLSAGFERDTAKLNIDSNSILEELNKDLTKGLSDLNESFKFVEHFQQMEAVVKTYASQTFGATVAERAMAKAKLR